MASKELTDLSIKNAPPQISEGGLAAKNRIAQARANKNAGGVRQGATIAAPVVASSTTPVITPSSLEPASAPVVSPIPQSTLGTELLSNIEVKAEDALANQVAQQRLAAEGGRQTALEKYIATLNSAKTQGQLQQEQYGLYGVDAAKQEANDYAQELRAKKEAFVRTRKNIQEKGGGLEMGANAEIANIESRYLNEATQIAILQEAAQGRYEGAVEMADRAVKAQFEAQTQAIDVAKFDYTENKDLFTTAEQREYDLLFSDRERQLKEAQDNAASIKQFALSALEAGASISEVKQAMGAKTLDEAIGLVGSYLRPKAIISAPEVKNFGTTDAPIWKQYDPSTGQWMDVSGVTGIGATGDIEKTKNQISFLQNTIKDANQLVEATGPNLLSQGLGNVFVGNTRVKQLQNKIDTLKTNLLTLNSDPNLKKFFGPQMTEKDTELLMSAGSTLNAYSNSVEDNKEELARYSALLSKMAAAIPNGVTTPELQTPQIQGVDSRLFTGNLQLAPDGTQVEIID
jgi:hypothetical protein